MPDIHSEYDPSTDSMLLALFHRNPPGKILRRQHTFLGVTFPSLSKYLSQTDIDLAGPFLGLDDSRTCTVMNEKIMNPSNSVIRTTKQMVNGKLLGRSMIVKDNLLMGIREKEAVITKVYQDESGQK